MNSGPDLHANSKNVTPAQSLLTLHQSNIKDNTSYLLKADLPNQSHIQINEQPQHINQPIPEMLLEDSGEELHQINPKSNLNNKNSLLHNQPKYRLLEIQSERSKIIGSLKEVNNQISSIKNQNRSTSQLRRRELIAEDVQAHKNAIELVNYYKERKKELEEKKKNQTYKIILNLKSQFASNKKKQEELELARKQQKRNAISQRLNEAKKTRQNEKIIEHQTNKFINKMLRQEKQLQKHKIDLLRQESNNKIYFLQKHHANHSLHQSQQKSSQSGKSTLKKDKSEPINHPIRKYKKTKWTLQLQDIHQKEKQQKIIQKLNKQNGRRKRLKYGELVVSLFSQKKRIRTLPNPEERPEYSSIPQNSQSIHLAQPIIPTSKETSQLKVSRRQTQSLRISPMKNQSNSKSQYIQQSTFEEMEAEKERKHRQKQLRRETNQRMKRIQQENAQKPQSYKYQSNYQNYLGMLKLKKHNGAESWNKILNDQQSTREQKYQKMMREAESLENRAKFKEEVYKRPDKESDDLLMESIQAKLMMLQHM